MEEFKFNEALKSIWELISFCNKYINEEKPWEALASPKATEGQGKKNASRVISDVLFALDKISDLLLPFLPETSEKIKKDVEGKKSEILFPKIAERRG